VTGASNTPIASHRGNILGAIGKIGRDEQGAVASIALANRRRIPCHARRNPLSRGRGMSVPGANDR
jgi:hypothetical protein